MIHCLKWFLGTEMVPAASSLHNMGSGDSAVDWSGLLKWSLQYTDGTTPSGTQPLSSSDVAWLHEAFASRVVDQVKSMRGYLKYLSSEVGTPVQELGEDVASVVSGEETKVKMDGKLEAAEELRDIVSQIDLANDLPKVGGVPVLMELLASQEPSLRAHGCGLWQTVAKDNPNGQAVALSAGALAPLMALMDNPSHPAVQAQAMGAVSALVQNCPPARTAFCDPERSRGVEFLVRVVDRAPAENATETERSGVLRVRRRALFFLRTLLEAEDSAEPMDGTPLIDVASLAKDAGLGGACARLAGDPDIELREGAAAVLQLLKLTQ